MKCRGPVNRLVMHRARGLTGPFFQNVGNTCVHSTGNYIGTVGGHGLKVIGGISATVTVGSTTPIQRTFSVEATDEDGNQLPWTISESTAWLSVAPTSGTGLTTITATIDPTGLAVDTYTGDVTITADGAAGSPKTLTARLTVQPPVPVASFTYDKAFGQPPLTVQFTDTSTNTPTSWLWTFGDGATSTEQNPQHTYVLYGTYTVTLKACNAVGCTTAIDTDAISVAGLPSADDLAGAGNWIDKGFWFTGLAYGPTNVVEHQGRYFINHVGGTASSVNEPGVGSAWEDYWYEISDVGIDPKSTWSLAVPSDSYQVDFNLGASTDLMVDWGDGTVENRPGAQVFNRTYATAGTYSVRMFTASSNGLRWFCRESSVNAIATLVEWGQPALRDTLYQFCASVTKPQTIPPIPAGRTGIDAGYMLYRNTPAGVTISSPAEDVDFTTSNRMFSASAAVLPTNPATKFICDADCTMLFNGNTSATLDEFIVNGCINFRGATNLTDAWLDAAISKATLDYVLAECVAGGQTTVPLNVAAAAGVEPSGAGWANIATLQSRGWTVTHNGLAPYWYYELEDASGSTVVDHVNGHDGTLVNGSFPTVSVPGVAGNGVVLNGIDQMIQPPWIADMIAGAWAVSFWCRWPSLASAYGIFKAPGGNSNTNTVTMLSYLSGALTVGVAGGTVTTGPGGITTDTWYHIAITYDGVGETRWFLNGTLVGTRAGAAGYSDTSAAQWGYVPGQLYAPVTLDDLRWHNGVYLTEAQAQQIRDSV